MKQIQLANNKGIALVDDEDFEELNRHKWHLLGSKYGLYAVTCTKQVNRWVNVLMHRIIMHAQKGQYIDHKDVNGLNNQKTNLRFCTNSQNCMNWKARLATSVYKGVCWEKRRKKWSAQIGLNYKKIHIGYFDTAKEAAKAYDTKAKEFYGEFARLNF